MRFILLLLLGLLLGGVESAAAPTSLRLMFIGDSLTAGYGLSPQLAFPAQVEKIFRGQSFALEVINAGVSGDTTNGGRRRLDWQMRANPDWVVIALGANDMLRGISPQATKAHLEEMIQKLQAEEKKVFLFGMQASATLGREYVESFNRLYVELAQKYQLPFLPLFIERVVNRPELNLSDRIHPNEEGHRLIAEDVAAFLEPHVKKWFQERKEQIRDSSKVSE